jgi:hypothetical protein
VLLVAAFISGNDNGFRDDTAARIANEAGNLAVIELGKRRGGNQQQGNPDRD